jgi:hypothetical protein
MTRLLNLTLALLLPALGASLALWVVFVLIDRTDLPVPSTYGLKVTAFLFALPIAIGVIIFAWFKVTQKSGRT